MSLFLLLVVSAGSITGCIGGDDSTSASAAPTASKAFLNLTFNTNSAYFSTDGSMASPVDSIEAKSKVSKIDITFIFNRDYTQPGFFDPVARSKEWYWHYDYQPWLSGAIETRFYSTELTQEDFESARIDQSKIAVFFSDTNAVLAPHAIYPEGSCIGGRQTGDPTSILLSQGKVFGFKNTASGKRGLLYIRADQYYGWPTPISSFNTKVDIIREN